MKTLQFVNEGLGNSSYVLELGEGRAVLIDPDRSVNRYLDYLKSNELGLVGVFETHLHADFVSGALELAARLEAPIFMAKDAEVRFPHQGLAGGQKLTLDGSAIEVLASPGHTPEHLSFVFRGAAGPPMLFSGGSLIVGGAARTDLIAPEATEGLTRAQFRTLREAFNALPDETLLYPTHGGGSFCSTGTASERWSTLGRERRDNPLLDWSDEKEFVTWFPTTFPAVPAYFARMRPINQAGPRLVRDIPMPGPLEADAFQAQLPRSLVIDVRSKDEYASGHIRGALSNPLRDDYSVWLGWLVPAEARLLFVTGRDEIDRVVDASLLVGYEKFGGWLQGGMASWEASGKPVSRVELAGAVQAHQYILAGAAVLDVREPSEFAAGHIEDAMHVPLGELARSTALVPRDRPVVVYCGHGERASTAVSLLESAGFGQLVNLDGGIGAWRAGGYAVKQGA